MSSKQNAPGGGQPPGAPFPREEGPAKAPQQPTTPPSDVLSVHWKQLRNSYFVLATDDGKAAGWACSELGPDGRDRFRYGVGGTKHDATSIYEARSRVVAQLARSCREVGMVLCVRQVGREDA